MTNREKVVQMANWAAEEGDPDVLLTCERALGGDGTAEQEALDWWPAWSTPRRLLDVEAST